MSYQPQPQDKEFMQLAAEAAMAKLPDEHCLILMVADKRKGQESRMYYASNMTRESALNCLKEFLIKAGAEEDWMKHIK
jgi:hypothetical protein